MRPLRATSLLLVAALEAAGAPPRAGAAPAPALTAADPRIETLAYDPDRIVPLNPVVGYQMMIRFGADERIENVAIGDATNWQVTPNKGANLLFLRPLGRAPRTNMTVVTDRRSYLFDLRASAGEGSGAGGIVYVLRFTYPPDPVVAVSPPPPPPPAPEQRNRAYTYTGSRSLLPSLVFDDGKFTYFKWPESESTPAIFLLGRDGAESLVDYSFRDGYQVVEQTAPRFRLRSGKEVTTLVNEGWRDPGPGDLAPRPGDAKTARAAERAGGERP